MKRSPAASIAAAGGLVATTAACATTPGLAVPLHTVSGKPLRIWTISAEDKGDSVLVYGRVRRPQLALGQPSGHLHVVARFADGRPDLIADTRWGSIPSRGSRTAYYSVCLPIADADAVTNITVSYASSADVVDAPSGMNP